MLVMCHDIRIANRKLRFVEAVAVKSSVDHLSDTCTITLPTSAYKDVEAIKGAIERGQAVTVRLGYDDDLKTEFEGYVRRVSDSHPVKVECEDSAFLFRKPIKDKSFKKTTVLAVLQYALAEINSQLSAEQKLHLVTDLKGLQFDSFTIVFANGYEVLEKIKQEFGIAIYCRGRELHCHLLYTEKRGVVTYDFHRNIEKKHQLEWVQADDRKVKVTINGVGKKKGKISVSEGKDGDQEVVLNRPNVSDKPTLQRIARQELKKRSYNGYKGKIVGWLKPFCAIGYTAYIVHREQPERDGGYFVKAVDTEFSKSGGVRSLEIGIKVLTKTYAPVAEADLVDTN